MGAILDVLSYVETQVAPLSLQTIAYSILWDLKFLMRYVHASIVCGGPALMVHEDLNSCAGNG